MENIHPFSSSVLKKMFGGKKVSPVLPYHSPSNNNNLIFNKNQTHISISGFQQKNSLVLEGSTLRLTNENERGQFILKPISDLPKNSEFAPTNEHLTMQIAEKIFKIETAESVLVYFQDGILAYLTKRFDVNENGEKLAVEDFASLLQKSPATHGEHYKYSGNYLDLFQVLQKFVPAWQVETPKLLGLILFNYLFSNGDAHLKNFSLVETSQGDFKLSPAYDLMNTSLHIEDEVFALKEGLLPKSISKGKVLDQFLLLGKEAKIPDTIIKKIITNFTTKSDRVLDMVNQSLLSDKLKRHYIQSYQTRLKKIRV